MTRPYSPVHTIALTAAREIHVVARLKSVWFTVALLLIGIVGIIGVIGWKANSEESDSAPVVATVGLPASAFDGSGLEPRDAPDRSAAEQLVRDGDVEAAVVASPSGWELVDDGAEASSSIYAHVNQAASFYSTTAALSALGVSPADFAAASPNTTVTLVDLSADADTTDADFTRLGLVFAALIIIMFTVVLFAANVGSRVTVEKSSRVVELVLASVKPRDFLAGKLLGAIAIGFATTLLVIGAGSVALAVTGLASDISFDWGIVPVLLGAWLAAMLFFGALYAAAGALVQRSEDLQSTQMPVLLLLMATMYIPLLGWLHTSETWMQVASWIPPFSIFAAPLTYAAGNFSAVKLAASFALALVATAGVVWLAGRIYKNSILNNGRKMSWLKAAAA
ncbi:ABC-2 family transporter protein [Corynebacterium capitovis DSM 44611]|uniref:ABC transporter permease n=1 Tax=Corynebacterium capitovis TaxID=131081 RepID=UPI000362F5A5|nr:ABC transporter permease [Corynebacterium capitovis]WKD58084.1 ABC-2 family transporter protein [Corynebacterium capitovis DSM 44611]